VTGQPGGQRQITAILDRSALQSFARGHVHVGELMGEIGDEEDAFVGIPTAALAEAHASLLGRAHARALLRLITILPVTKVLDLDRDTAAAMSGALPLTNGDMARAHAVWAANKHGALYLTTEPDRAKSLVPADNIHPIPTEDA
jgi:hypothetical protein